MNERRCACCNVLLTSHMSYCLDCLVEQEEEEWAEQKAWRTLKQGEDDDEV